MTTTNDFDPTHALDGWRAPAPAPLDLELRSLGRSAGSGPDAATRARLKARGYEMRDVEDVELTDLPLAPALPALDLPAAAPSPNVQARAFIDALRMPDVPPAPAGGVAPALDLPPQPPAPVPEPRLLAAWQPGCWTAGVHRLVEARVELLQTAAGLNVEHVGPQWLVALWRPREGAGSSAEASVGWPEQAGVLCGDTEDAALRQCLPGLPLQARLHAGAEGADWGLVAELVLQQQAGLGPVPAQALRNLASAQREARQRRMAEAYVFQDGLARRRA